MSTSDLESQMAAAKAYEKLFVPALFKQWAPAVVASARITPGQNVLDVACGTGVLTREAQLRCGSGKVVGLDRNAGMLAVAREVSPSIEWRQGTAESLPLETASFDAVISQFGLMFMDQERALREMLRVLKPGGQLAVAVWDSVENIPAYAAEVDLFQRVAGQPAADALRAPFTLGDKHKLVELCERAGVHSPSITTLAGVAKFPSIRALVEADLRGWLPIIGVNLSESTIEQTLVEAESVFASYVNSGWMEFPLHAHVVAATKS